MSKEIVKEAKERIERKKYFDRVEATRRILNALKEAENSVETFREQMEQVYLSNYESIDIDIETELSARTLGSYMRGEPLKQS